MRTAAGFFIVASLSCLASAAIANDTVVFDRVGMFHLVCLDADDGRFSADAPAPVSNAVPVDREWLDLLVQEDGAFDVSGWDLKTPDGETATFTFYRFISNQIEYGRCSVFFRRGSPETAIRVIEEHLGADLMTSEVKNFERRAGYVYRDRSLVWLLHAVGSSRDDHDGFMLTSTRPLAFPEAQ